MKALSFHHRISWFSIGAAIAIAFILFSVGIVSEPVHVHALQTEPYTRYVNVGDCEGVSWQGVYWESDQPYAPGSWGHVGSDFNPREPGYVYVRDASGQEYDDDGQYLHRCRAYGTDFGYRFDVPDGDYVVRLRFVEPLRTAGERWFDVMVQGQPVLDDFDIAATAGDIGAANQQTFNVTVTGGQLTIDFVGNQGSDDPAAIVQAIAIEGLSVPTPEPTTVTPEPTTVTPEPTTVTPEPTTVTPEPTTVTAEPTTVTAEPTTVTAEPTTVTPVPTTVTPDPTTQPAYEQYVNVGKCDDITWNGHTWAAAQPYESGSWGYLGSSFVQRPPGTSRLISDENGDLYGDNGQYLHRCRMYGTDFGFRFDVPDGTYTVRLRFADPSRRPGQRWFDVLIGGQLVLDDFDIAARAGGRAIAIERAFSVTVTGGSFQIDFVGNQGAPRDNKAIVQAISVVGSGPAPTQPPPTQTVTPVPTTVTPEPTTVTAEPTTVTAEPTTVTPIPTTPPPITYEQYVNVGDCDEGPWDGHIWEGAQAYSSGGWGYLGSDYRLRIPGISPEIMDENGFLYDDDGQYLHRCRMYGTDFSFRFDVDPGQYLVTLRFADAFRDPGERWFDVSILGQVVLDDFDVADEAGGKSRVVTRKFNVVTDGPFQIDFIGNQGAPVDEKAIVQAISVVGGGDAGPLPTAEPSPTTDPTDPPPTTDPSTTPQPTPTTLPPGINLVTVHPTPIDGFLTNPGIGWQEAHDISDPRIPESTPYRRWNWADFNPERGVYNWNKIEDLCDEAWENGGQCHFGIVMSSRPYWGNTVIPQWVQDEGAYVVQRNFDGEIGYDPDYANCTWLEAHDLFVNALREKYDGDPRIFAIDIRSYGRYGEWTGEGLQNSYWRHDEEARHHIIDTWVGGSGSHICHQTNVYGPDVMTSYDHPGFQETPVLFTHSWHPDIEWVMAYDNPVLGIRHDCLGPESHNNNVLKYLDEFTAHADTAPVAFEFCSYAYSQQELDQAAEVCELTGCSVVHDNFAGGGSTSAIQNMVAEIGYRFQLHELTHPDRISLGESVALGMIWENVGIAPAYRDYRLKVILTNSQGIPSVMWSVDPSVRTWQPGQQFDVMMTGTVPDDLAPGNYNMWIALVDPDSGEPINLSITGRNTDGLYLVSSVVVTN